MIEIKSVSKVYELKNSKSTVALTDVSLSFANHGLYVILGPSGSGKSTLLSLIGGLDTPTSGEILYNNIDITKLSEKELDQYRRNDVSFIFQDHNLIEYLSLKDNSILKSSNSTNHDELFEKLEISQLLNKKPSTLSGGEKERGAIARSVLSSSSVILSDEPTSSLDIENATKVMEILKDISKNRLVIVVSHDQELCEKYADSLIFIRDGKITKEQKASIEDRPCNEPNIINNKVYKSKIFSRALAHLRHNYKFTALMLILTTVAFYSASNIIGLAKGTNDLINDVETSLTQYSPLSISSYYQNLNGLYMFGDLEEVVREDGTIGVVSEQNIVSSLHKNIVTNEFLEYLNVNKKEDTKLLVDGDHSYSVIYQKDGDYVLFDEQRRDSLNDYLQTFLGKRNTIYSLLYKENDFKNRYTWLEGTFPKNDNEAIVVLSDGGLMMDSVSEILNAKTGDAPSTLIGKTFNIANHKDLYYESDSQVVTGHFMKSKEQLKNEYKDIRELNYQLIKYVNDYYDGNNQELEVDKTNIKNLFNDTSETRTLKAYSKIQNSTQLEAISKDKNKSEEIKIVGVATTKYNSVFEQGDAGILIPDRLLTTIRERNSQSEIANEIDNHIILNDGESIPAFKGYLNIVNDIGASGLYDYVMGLVDFFESRKFFSTNNEISSVQIRTDSKENRQFIANKISEYNADKDEAYKIKEYDLTKKIILMIDRSFGTVAKILYTISIITMVISGVISLILIFNMVASRKKEIGIYRASGYSKGYVFSLFEVESVFIGTVSGLLGLAIAHLTTPLFDKMLSSGGSKLFTNVMHITPMWSLIIAISCIAISFLAALIPSIIYSTKKPNDVLK